MKKLPLSILLIPAIALAQSCPSPTFNNLNLKTLLSSANGGTGTISATGKGSVMRATSPSISSPMPTGSPVVSALNANLAVNDSGESNSAGVTFQAARSPLVALHSNSAGNLYIDRYTQGAYRDFPFSASSSAGAIRLSDGLKVDGATNLGTPTIVGTSLYPAMVAPVNTTATTTSGSRNITVTSAAGITTGMGIYSGFVSACSSPGAAFEQAAVTAVSGNTVMMSCPATATNSSAVAVQFGQQRYSPTSTFLANDLGAQTIKVGSASQGNSATWLNQVSTGQDYRLTSAAQIIAPPGGGYGLTVAARSSDATGGAAAFPFQSIFLADAWRTANHASENSYFQSNLSAATAGKAIHVQTENSINSQWGSPPAEDPFSINVINQTIAHRYDCGTGQGAATGMSGCTTAIDIVPNPETFENGIVIANGALDTGNGTRQASAISMPPMVGLTWFSTPSNFSAAIYSPSAGVLYHLVPAGGQFNYIVNGNVMAVINDAGFSVNGLIAPSSTSGIKGTVAGDNANAGSVGEFVNSEFSSVSVSNTAIAQNLTNVTLTPGDWDVEGAATYTSRTGATMSIWLAGVNTTSGTMPSLGNYFQSGGSITATGAATAIPPVTRINVSSATTVYLVGEAVFSGGSVTAAGVLRARRVR